MPDHPPLPTGWDMSESQSALSNFLETLPTRPQVLALGEPGHDMEAFRTWRNRLLRTLVEDHGFRSIALESDIFAGQKVNAHVTSGQHSLEEVMGTGFSHGFGARPANRELVEWLRDFNVGRLPANQVRFYGFDPPLENLWAASPRASLLALHDFLSAHLGHLAVGRATLEQLCGDDAPWTDPAAALDPSRSVGDGRGARHLRRLSDDLVALLHTETPGLAARPGFWEAQLHARTATGLLRYHAVIADPAPDRIARMLRLRGLMMADHLSAIVGREGGRGPTLVFAHNAHLQRDLSTMQMRGTTLEWWSAGAHLHLRLEGGYAFVAGHLGTVQGQAASPETPRGVLMGLPFSATLLAARNLAATPAESLAAGTDGVLFLKEAAAL